MSSYRHTYMYIILNAAIYASLLQLYNAASPVRQENNNRNEGIQFDSFTEFYMFLYETYTA